MSSPTYNLQMHFDWYFVIIRLFLQATMVSRDLLRLEDKGVIFMQQRMFPVKMWSDTRDWENSNVSASHGQKWHSKI